MPGKRAELSGLRRKYDDVRGQTFLAQGGSRGATLEISQTRQCLVICRQEFSVLKGRRIALADIEYIATSMVTLSTVPSGRI